MYRIDSLHVLKTPVGLVVNYCLLSKNKNVQDSILGELLLLILCVATDCTRIVQFKSGKEEVEEMDEADKMATGKAEIFNCLFFKFQLYLGFRFVVQM